MSNYRNDLDAARHRIATLEAELSERDAAVRARDARIAELEAELGRLRGAAGLPRSTDATARSNARLFAVLGAAALVLMGGLGAFLLVKRSAPVPLPPVAGAPAQPQPSDPTSAGGDRSVAENGSDNLADAVEAAAERLRPKVLACHRKELAKRPEAKGFLKVTFYVEKTGKVSNVDLGKSDVRSVDFDACVKPLIDGLTFSPTDTRTQAQMSFALIFDPMPGLGL
jgi:hypothetical protein